MQSSQQHALHVLCVHLSQHFPSQHVPFLQQSQPHKHESPPTWQHAANPTRLAKKILAIPTLENIPNKLKRFFILMCSLYNIASIPNATLCMSDKRYSRQQIKKLYHKSCFFCGESDYNLLDVHRILEGANGGTYHPNNTLVGCATCHRKIHSGRIVVHGKHYSTSGHWVIHYTEDGKEHWKNEN